MKRTCWVPPTCMITPRRTSPRATPGSRAIEPRSGAGNDAAGLAAHDVAGERLVFSEVQDRVLAPAVDPEAARRIAVARPHGDQTDMRGLVPPGPHIAGDEIALIGHGARLDRIAAAELAA